MFAQGYVRVSMHTHTPIRSQSPALDCLWFPKSPQPKLFLELVAKPCDVLCASPAWAAQPRELSREGLSLTLTNPCSTLTLFLGRRYWAPALATWTSSRLLRHVTLWL